MNILITGGCWFVGHHIIEHIFKNTDWDITIIDRLSYSGSVDRLRDINVYDDSLCSFNLHYFSNCGIMYLC